MTSQREGTPGRYRYVSELRIQFLCEYRLHLKWNLGERISDAGVGSTHLHQHVPLQTGQAQSVGTAAKILVIMVTVLAALLWIIG
ncbi:MAG: hypothetical protein ACXADO_06250 [Candidatus Thorarchaeota archaeon]